MFSISLMVLAPLHFIGATFVFIFSLLIITEFINFTQDINLVDNFYRLDGLDYIFGFLILNSFVSCFYKTPSIFSKINRYTLGLNSFKVYTEVHTNGIRVFKINAYKNSKLIFKNLFQVYNERGGIGSKYNYWRPAILFGLTYRITDICERRLSKDSTEEDEKILISTFKNVISLNQTKIKDIDVLKFYVKTINPDNAKENLENWIREVIIEYPPIST